MYVRFPQQKKSSCMAFQNNLLANHIDLSASQFLRNLNRAQIWFWQNFFPRIHQLWIFSHHSDVQCHPSGRERYYITNKSSSCSHFLPFSVIFAAFVYILSSYHVICISFYIFQPLSQPWPKSRGRICNPTMTASTPWHPVKK